MRRTWTLVRSDPQWAVDRILALERERDQYVRAFNALEKAVARHVANSGEVGGLAKAHRDVMVNLWRRAI